MDQQLPVMEIVPELKKLLAQNTRVILEAPPGAGKSTVLPLQLLKEDWLKGKKIIMLEPRRLAARTVAMRMASLIGEEVGKTVGYRVRFENKVSNSTIIEVVTEGILTRMLQSDNALEGVALVIFDEFHERSLHADLALALCTESQQILREDLKILIMSATLDSESISEKLKAPIIKSLGRQFPVEQRYFPVSPTAPLHLEASRAIRKIFPAHQGDFLVFLPGVAEIHKTQEILEQELPYAKICPLYGELTVQKQQEAILPDKNIRKIVLATSIAETSLTIEGITVVVDCGYARVPRFDPRSGLTKLETVKVTQDAATQRAGRAGRLGPGICYRLWEEVSHQHLLPNRNPEILEADLAPLVLELANWGVKDPASLFWLTPPPAGALGQATSILNEIGALKESNITSEGKKMLQFPTHPRLAHMIITAQKANLCSVATDLAAILEERDPLSKDAGANIYLRIEALRNYRGKSKYAADRAILDRIERSASAWRKHLKTEQDNTLPSQETIGLLIAAAYPERIAKRRNQLNNYRLANGRIAKLSEYDLLNQEEYIAIAHMDAGINEGKVFLAAPLSPYDLEERIYLRESVHWDNQKELLIAQKEERIGDIILKTSPLDKIPEGLKNEVLCEVVRKEGTRLLPLSEEAQNLQSRILCLKAWREEEEWPDVSNEFLFQNPEAWLVPYLSNIRKKDDFKKLDTYNILLGMLPWPLSQQIDTLAPSKLQVPSGSLIPIEYFTDGRPPVLAARLQEMFGLFETPTINEGKTPLLLHLLSPGYKPVQVTQDLKSFWKNTYPIVRKELRVRYQKHFWPEDPWTAEAVRGVKRKNF